MTIEPFHGKNIVIRKRIAGRCEIIWTYDKPVDFGHVVWGGLLRGRPTFITGYRKEAAELLIVQADPASLQPGAKLRLTTTVIEAGTGPSNVAVLNGPDEDIIIAANRMIGEAALYIVRD
jgi:hypothetical protein